MSFRIEHDLEVDAACETVWEVITDLPRYSEWNPFVASCQSTLEPGDPIHMRVHIFRAFAQPQTETIFEHVPGRRVCYGVEKNSLRALWSHRCHSVEAAEDGRARYRSRFELSGWLAPVVRWLFGSRMRRGFDEMSIGIKQRSEFLSNR